MAYHSHVFLGYPERDSSRCCDALRHTTNRLTANPLTDMLHLLEVSTLPRQGTSSTCEERHETVDVADSMLL